MVHPITGFGFGDAEEGHALEGELAADEGRQIEAAGERVAAEDGGIARWSGEGGDEVMVGFLGKEGDLSGVVGFVIEKTIADEAAAGDALNFCDGEERVFGGGSAVAPEVVMSRGNKKSDDAAGGAVGRGGMGCHVGGCGGGVKAGGRGGRDGREGGRGWRGRGVRGEK